MSLQAIVFNACLPVYVNTTYELHLSRSLQSLDRELPFHCRLPVGQLFHVDQLYRSAGPGIARAAPLVVNDNPFLRVHRPAGVVRAVRALDDIAIEAHLTYAVFADRS